MSKKKTTKKTSRKNQVQAQKCNSDTLPDAFPVRITNWGKKTIYVKGVYLDPGESIVLSADAGDSWGEWELLEGDGLKFEELDDDGCPVTMDRGLVSLMRSLPIEHLDLGTKDMDQKIKWAQMKSFDYKETISGKAFIYLEIKREDCKSWPPPKFESLAIVEQARERAKMALEQAKQAGVNVAGDITDLPNILPPSLPCPQDLAAFLYYKGFDAELAPPKNKTRLKPGWRVFIESALLAGSSVPDIQESLKGYFGAEASVSERTIYKMKSEIQSNKK